jgi:hypothetical protein
MFAPIKTWCKWNTKANQNRFVALAPPSLDVAHGHY